MNLDLSQFYHQISCQAIALECRRQVTQVMSFGQYRRIRQARVGVTPVETWVWHCLNCWLGNADQTSQGMMCNQCLCDLVWLPFYQRATEHIMSSYWAWVWGCSHTNRNAMYTKYRIIGKGCLHDSLIVSCILAMLWHTPLQPGGTPSITYQDGHSSMLCTDIAISGSKDVYKPTLFPIAESDSDKAAACKLRPTVFCAYGSGQWTVSTRYENTTSTRDSDSIIAATTNVQVWGITQLLLTAWTVHHCQEQAGSCQWLVCLARPWTHQKLAPVGTCRQQPGSSDNDANM